MRGGLNKTKNEHQNWRGVPWLEQATHHLPVHGDYSQKRLNEQKAGDYLNLSGLSLPSDLPFIMNVAAI